MKEAFSVNFKGFILIIGLLIVHVGYVYAVYQLSIIYN